MEIEHYAAIVDCKGADRDMNETSYYRQYRPKTIEHHRARTKAAKKVKQAAARAKNLARLSGLTA